MGTNTDAILFYGFHGDEGAWDNILVCDVLHYVAWEDRLAQLSGVADPGPFRREAVRHFDPHLVRGPRVAQPRVSGGRHQ